MYRHGVSHIQLAQQIGGIYTGALIKPNGDQFAGGIDLLNDAHVAVEDPGAHGAVVLLPHGVIVVAGLHDPVPLPEHQIAPLLLMFPGGGRVQRRLQGPVQIHRAAHPLAGGGQHLDLLRRDAHFAGQPVAAQLHHRLHQPVRRTAAQEEKVVLRVVQFRRPAAVHRVGVADDGAGLRLAEDLCQGHRGDHAAAQQVAQHVARADRRQLVRVAHHHKAAAGAHGPQQRRHQLQIHHAHLVHDNRVRFQRLLFVFAEGHLVGQVVPAHAQRPVDGLGVTAAQLAHPLGGPSGGGQQQHVQPHPLKQGHDAPHRGGLAGARPAGQQQHALFRRQRHRPALLRRVGDPLPGLNVVDNPVHVLAAVPFVTAGGGQPLGHIDLRLVHPPQVAALHVGDRSAHHRAALRKLVQRLFRRLLVDADQLHGGGDQLRPGQEHMAVGQVVVQLIQDRRLRAAGVVAVKPHGQRDLVGGGKLHAAALIRQQIGILLQPRQRLVAVGPQKPHGQCHRQVVPAQELHHPPQARQAAEGGGDLRRFFGGDALDGMQLFRLLLDHPQGVRSEPLHQPRGGGRAYALQHAGGEVGDDVILLLGHPPLHQFGGHLHAVGGMVDPHAGNGHALAGGGKGDAAHHGDHLALIGQQAQHRISVFLVLENHVFHSALNGTAFPHGCPPVSSV